MKRVAWVYGLCLLGCGSPTPPAPHAFASIDPFVGSGGFGYATGSAFPGAAAPHGLAKAGPDTSGKAYGTIRFLHCAGYWFDDETVQGFSQLHLHGTGIPDYGLIGLMPVPAFTGTETNKTAYQSTYAKNGEVASPGYYALTLDNGNIVTEITATTHAAHYRITYPGNAAGHIVLDVDHTIDTGTVSGESLQLGADGSSATGKLTSQGSLSKAGYDVYFALRTKTPWSSAKVWSQGHAPAAGTSASGTGVGAELELPAGAPIELQIGLSMVSVDGAVANLAAEMPDFAFDATRAATAEAWQSLIDRVRFTGASPREAHILSAALYHLYLMPTDIADVDGSYFGMDGQVHHGDGFRYVSDLSLWDTYRTLQPIYDLIAPDAAHDAVQSLSAMAQYGGSFPRWPLATKETGTEIGASAEVILADAYVKGIPTADPEGDYQLLRAAALDATEPAGGRGGRDAIGPYMDFGYVPADQGSSVSKTLEYSYDDFALGNFAALLGHADDAAALHTRATSYRALFDPATGFLRARTRVGAIASATFDATLFSDEYVEANAWQSLWYAAHDIDGFVALFGGQQQMIDKLTMFFEASADEWAKIDPSNPASMGALAAQRPYYWAGNEPDIQAVYLFAQAGRPDLTQKWVRWIQASFYGEGPDGLPGNDDGGTLSAWYLFSSMGLYPIPGSDRYVVGAPSVPHFDLQVGGGHFTIDAPDVSATNLYVQSVMLNGAPLMKAELRHTDLSPGGNLTFVMGPQPSQWGR